MSSGYTPYPSPEGTGWAPPEGQRGYLQGGPVGFGQAISEALKNIVTFHGRASRSAYWWFFLATFIIGLIMGIIAYAAHVQALQYVVEIILGLASLSLAVRRLHDSGRTGWWVLFNIIPIIGTITLIVFYCLPGTPGPNKYDA